MDSIPKFQLLTSESYLNDLQNELSQSPSEVRILCFHISAQNMMLSLVPYLHSVLQQKGIVEIFADAEFSTHNFTDKVWLFLNNTEALNWNEGMRQTTMQMYEDLQSNGAILRLNESKQGLIKKFLPVYKSDHRKITTILRQSGERVAYFGGVNFDNGAKNDFMIKTVDQEIAEEIQNVSSKFDSNRIEKNEPKEFKSKRFTSLFDIGIPFSSIIMKSAKQMIELSKNKIFYVTHLPPELGVLLSFIKAEKHGVNIKIVLPNENDPHLKDFPYNIAYAVSKIILKILRSKIEFEHINKFSHAKILIVDDEVLVGSHNLSSMGVMSGIKEYSAKIKNAQFLSDVERFVDLLK